MVVFHGGNHFPPTILHKTGHISQLKKEKHLQNCWQPYKVCYYIVINGVITPSLVDGVIIAKKVEL